ncbi:hypothetical protein E2320_007340 [Naja naja]|nr:hypothetical protein E2320_007340 [Naja naja]
MSATARISRVDSPFLCLTPESARQEVVAPISTLKPKRRICVCVRAVQCGSGRKGLAKVWMISGVSFPATEALKGLWEQPVYYKSPASLFVNRGYLWKNGLAYASKCLFILAKPLGGGGRFLEGGEAVSSFGTCPENKTKIR